MFAYLCGIHYYSPLFVLFLHTSRFNILKDVCSYFRILVRFLVASTDIKGCVLTDVFQFLRVRGERTCGVHRKRAAGRRAGNRAPRPGHPRRLPPPRPPRTWPASGTPAQASQHGVAAARRNTHAAARAYLLDVVSRGAVLVQAVHRRHQQRQQLAPGAARHVRFHQRAQDAQHRLQRPT